MPHAKKETLRVYLFVLPFPDLHSSVCKQRFSRRTPGGGSIATGRWQHVHRAVAMLPPSGVRWEDGDLETVKSSFSDRKA